MTEELKVSFIQFDIQWEQKQRNLDLLTDMLKTAPKTDLMVLPEMFTTGFSMNAKDLAEDKDGPGLQWMRDMSKQYQMVVIGSIISKSSETYRNRLFFVKPDGRASYYDKRHLFGYGGEDKVFTAGKKCLIEKWKGWKICPQICYDLRFPVWSRNTQNYDLLLYAANWPDARSNAWNALLTARAIENQSYVLGVNRIGKGKANSYQGDSKVIEFSGKTMLDSKDEPGVFTTVLSKESLDQYRHQYPFLKDRDNFQLLDS